MRGLEEIEVDVVIAGGGACGLMAALQASQDPGLVVAVLEKSTREGCNAAISSGSLAAGGTRWQAAAGLEDSPQRHAEDILAASGDERHRPLVEALCRVAPTWVHWIADSGYDLDVGIDMPRKGMSVPRLHADPSRRGGGPLIAHLRGLLVDRPNVAFLDESPVTELRVEEGQVVGLEARQSDRRVIASATTTVLATDGFAGRRDLLREFAPEVGDPFHGGVSTATGDSVAWLRELDVEFRNMGALLRHGQVTTRGTRVNPNLPWLGAVMINRDGDRFVDEQAHGYSSLAPVIQAQPGERATVIWDTEVHECAMRSEMMRDSAAAGALGSSMSLEELSAALRVDVDRLAVALRPLPGRRGLRPPFHHARITHGVLATQGGAAIDTSGRVLRSDGSVIKGLRAGGGVAVGLAGPRSEGYSSGNGLMAAFGMGWIIGRDLAGAVVTS